MKPGDKLYVIVRADLPPGLQIAQAIHAQREYAAQHAESERAWYRASNTVAVLAVADELHLRRLIAQAGFEGAKTAVFHEPDRADEMTAAVVEPGPLGHRLCRKLPLALQT